MPAVASSKEINKAHQLTHTLFTYLQLIHSSSSHPRFTTPCTFKELRPSKISSFLTLMALGVLQNSTSATISLFSDLQHPLHTKDPCMNSIYGQELWTILLHILTKKSRHSAKISRHRGIFFITCNCTIG